MSLISELKRRNVFKVGGAYAVMSWLIIQLISTLVPALLLPEWTVRLVTILLIIGFPVALLFAWAFEMTAEGVKRTSDVSLDESITSTTGQKLNYVLVPALLIALFYMLYQQESGPTQTEPELINYTNIETTQSIAVLPFADMSKDSDQEYFSDGISEEILNVLVKIPELQVAGRTSSFAYKGKNQDLRTIGTELNVNHILEGSVRKSGTKLRITAQLIRSSDGFHLWSETYDREMNDIFEIQDDISKSIAEALAISLGIKQGDTLVKHRTDVPAAYEAYLKARAAYSRRNEGMNEAILHLSEVLIYDPNFVPAWALLAKTYSIVPYYQGNIITGFSETSRDEMWDHYIPLAQRTVDLALALDPNYPETLVAQANIYKEQYNYAMADRTYKRAIALNPRDADAYQQYTEVLIILGLTEKAVQEARIANTLDPNVPILMNVLAWALVTDNKPVEALEVINKALVIDPTLGSLYNNLLTANLLLRDLDAAIETTKIRPGMDDDRRAEQIQFFQDFKNEPALINDHKTWLAVQFFRGRSSLAAIKDMDIMGLIIRLQERSRYGQFQAVNGLTSEMWADPRARQMLDYQNILEGWQEAGFPSHCKPIGDADFECTG